MREREREESTEFTRQDYTGSFGVHAVMLCPENGGDWTGAMEPLQKRILKQLED